MVLRFYIEPWCIFCKYLEPRLKAFFSERGLELEVYKLKGCEAFQVNGEGRERVLDIDQVPALRVGGIVLFGFGILGFLRDALNGQ